MGGRFYFFLAITALLALVASLGWAGALLFGRAAPHLDWQWPALLLPFAIVMAAVRPRDEGERLLSGAGIGLHAANRRRALASCFAPYRPRRGLAGLGRSGPGRPTVAAILLIALFAATGLLLPSACFTAFALALRRAAWFGQLDAMLMERDWLGVRGPVRAGGGRRLAARAHPR